MDKLGKEIENLKFENKSLYKNVSKIRHPDSFKRGESGRGKASKRNAYIYSFNFRSSFFLITRTNVIADIVIKSDC